ncbi:MAG TPA: hypothetical protein DCE42_02550 [Myxococcales bacterium]|nr:hypothetical protein [Myxococcales bacterium]
MEKPRKCEFPQLYHILVVRGDLFVRGFLLLRNTHQDGSKVFWGNGEGDFQRETGGNKGGREYMWKKEHKQSIRMTHTINHQSTQSTINRYKQTSITNNASRAYKNKSIQRFAPLSFVHINAIGAKVGVSP